MFCKTFYFFNPFLMKAKVLSALALAVLLGTSGISFVSAAPLQETEEEDSLIEIAEEQALSESLRPFARFPEVVAKIKAKRIYKRTFHDQAPITEVLLEKEGDTVVYAIEFTQKDGNEIDIKINARNGRLVKIEDDRTDSDEDDANEKLDVAITGTALEKASAAALEYVGQGRVTETEIEDEESYYEVEVTLPNGQEVDVQLDENFKVVGSETDDAHDED
jgi:uncharacterized membrane protein YkoI